MSRAPRSRADVQAFGEIAAIGQLARNRLERALPDGLSQAQFNLLVRLASHGGEENPVSLAQAFQLTKGAMTNTLQRLEAQGFVAIKADADDGRRKRVSITPAGLAAHARGLAAARSAREGLRARFTDTDFETALPFLSALRQWLDENR
ncbi:MAG TPA: MarR family transcriptional regulator [Caulobacteraceae bacterium]|jgi:DNA-binding MarR family transcriptional regulator|nr:MarR family transcriptional regulator [Caulobacteraceae bacterium]